MRRMIPFLIFLLFSLGRYNTLAQDMNEEGVPGEYDPEEFISINSDLTMDVALEIIDQLSTKYEDKMIIDPGEHKGKIGVVVDNMHWKRALEYILKSNLLSYKTHPRHYEIVGMKEQEDKKGPSHITYETREIEIKAIFFEADHQTLSEIGIDWSTIKDGKVRLYSEMRAGSNVTSDLFSAGGQFIGKQLSVFTLIRTIQSLNKGQIIASPQIRIVEGQEGKIKVGKNFFLTTRDFAGNTRYSEYESGTILSVIPNIITEGKLQFIHLEIKAEKSDVVPSDVGVTKKITEGRTEVLLLNGEETAMAGLFSNEQTTLRKGVPILKDLPWWCLGLRFFFGYSSEQVIKKELIILIQAEIVPSVVSRLKSKILQKDYLQDRKQNFDKKLNELKKTD